MLSQALCQSELKQSGAKNFEPAQAGDDDRSGHGGRRLSASKTAMGTEAWRRSIAQVRIDGDEVCPSRACEPAKRRD